MGRTIHYSFDLKTPLPFEDQKKILDITEEYNTKYKWTCENVGFSNLGFFPNWEYFRKLVGENFPTKDIWGMIDKEYKALEKKGMHQLEVMANLHRKGFIRYHYGADPNGFPNAQKFHGFTKTAGNEWNSLLVISYLVAISKVVPKAFISVHDEGEFLYLPIKIKDGNAKIDAKDLLSSICYWKASTERHGSYFEDLIKKAHEKLEMFGIKCSYDFEQYNKRIFNGTAHKQFGKPKYSYEKAYRIKNLVFQGNKFRVVGDFCRKVNKADFDKHPQFRTMIIQKGKKPPKFENVMAGFYGEYWNKNHERVELESEQRNKFIFNLLNGMAGKEVDD